jgi:chromosome segregation ATPase
MLDVRQITALHANTVRLWHSQPVENTYRDFLYVICEEHKYNFLLWHEEDIARSRQAGDAQIAQVKRNIDQLNQKRNDWIERIDDTLKRTLDERRILPAAGAKWNTETPGAAIDRLSILALRIYHMEEQAERSDATPEHIARAQSRLATLAAQHEDLSTALGELLSDLFAGRKRLKLYRQLKMYNDPTLNPYLNGENPLRKAG